MRTEDGFHFAAGWLEDAVVAIRAAAEGIGGVDLGRPVRAAAASLPGSATAAAAATVIASWTSLALSVAGDLAAHADVLVACSDSYRRADAAAVDHLVAAPREVRRP
jgi:hypothetical protein